VSYYDYDDPPWSIHRLIRPGPGLIEGGVKGEEVGDPLPVSWMKFRPLCAESDPETFFPSKGDNPGAELARRICRRCPMTADCLDHNLDERYGIWGGTSEKERRVIRARLNRQRRPRNRVMA
jgi:WhiB family redox-sensing transcriptional regulator